MSKKVDPQKWLQRFNERITFLMQTKPFTVKMGEEDFYRFDLGQRVQFCEREIVIDIEPVGLKTIGNLIGMTGFYYNPKSFGARNVENVFEAWDWLIKKLEVDEKEFAEAIDTSSVLALLVTQIDNGLLYYFLALMVDLYELHFKGINVTPKISEIGKQVRSHMKKYQKLKEKQYIKSLLAIRNMWLFLIDMSSESALARFANTCGFDVILGKHPDLMINGKAFEVKRIRKSLLESKPADLSNPIRRGLKQNADVIAIEVNKLQQRKISDLRVTWLARNKLEKVLKNALAFNKKKKCILLFLGTNQGYFGRIILLKRIRN